MCVRSNKSVISLFSFGLLFFTVVSAYFVSLDIEHKAEFLRENGPIESLQAFILAINCFVFVMTALQKESVKWISFFCALICYSFLLREIDVELLNVPDVVKFFGSGVGRNTTILLGFVFLLAYMSSRFFYSKLECINFVKSKPGLLLIFGGVLLLLGDFFEKLDFVSYNNFYEEVLELFGYFIILFSALFFYYNAKSTKLKP
ncbi:MAG: hypothetical protein AB7U43_08905 [Desulfobacter sp.]